MARRPPRTSYGYLAPPEARVRGWRCANGSCGLYDDVAPRSWPYPCPHCGKPADATFEEPWAHEALAMRIRRDLTDPDEYVRGRARTNGASGPTRTRCCAATTRTPTAPGSSTADPGRRSSPGPTGGRSGRT